MNNKYLPFLTLLFFFASLPALAGHGISMDGKLKYAEGFSGFDYTSEEARVGGELTLFSIGAFDKMNPFTLKGEAPEMAGELLFESLAVQSLDEPFSLYGLLAQDISLADDQLSVTFTLRPEARFSDGSPVTPEDVVFSFDTLKSDSAHPVYQSYWRDILRAEKIDDRRVRFDFSQKNRELALIISELAVLNKAFYETHPFGQEDLTPPIGSGPYLVEKMDSGKTITYKRNPDYWGWKLPVRRGTYNFERITIKYFRDPVVALEAFKAGEFDFKHENNSKMWARDYLGDKFDSGKIIKETLPHKNGTGMQGFIFNLRKPIFQDIRVRKAMNLAFDFEWSNKNLFYGQYTRSASYFSNSELGATGLPSPQELQLLEPLRDKLSPEVFAAITPQPTTDPPASLRGNLRQAKALLEEAGFTLGADQVLVNQKGERLDIEMLFVSAAFERIAAPYAANLAKLGIKLTYRTVDPSLYQRRVQTFDFDMIVAVFEQSQSPGNEQRNMWHSSTAQVTGSRNFIGIADPAVDALVDAVIYAKSREELITSCHALDRVLLSGHYLVPNWHIPYHRVSYWDKFQRPKTLPLYYMPESWLMSWWMKE